MNYEIQNTPNGHRLKVDGKGDVNQSSRIFNCLLTGRSLNFYQSIDIRGGKKLASRVSEINEALGHSGLEPVSHKRIDTDYKGFYFIYFLTPDQVSEIKETTMVAA